MRFIKTCAAMLLAAATSLSQATVVSSTFVNTSGTTWWANFDVYNDGTVESIESLTIYFDYGKARDLVLIYGDPSWDTIVVQPDDVLQAPGFMDAWQADPSLGLREGTNLKGFQVQFEWSGTRAPGPFSFTVNDPLSFEALESGRTTVLGRDGDTELPEPGSTVLAALGLVAAVAARRRKA